jgi:thiol:disulfide interchange protein DsbD
MKRLLFVFSFFVFANILQGQIFEPVTWETSYKQVNDTEFDLIFTATIEDKWVIYSQYLPEADIRPVPTGFYFDAGDHFETVGKVKESGNIQTKHDKVFDMELTKFSETGIFTQRVKTTDLSQPITGYLEFMCCDDERCLPPTEVDFSFELKAEKKADTTPVEDKAAPVEKDKSTPEAQDKSTESSDNAKIEEVDQEPVTEEGTTTIGFEPTIPGSRDKMVQPVKWDLAIEKLEDGNYKLIYTANIDDGWGIYSQHSEEKGPVPTSFNYEEGNHFELIGEAIEEGDKKEEIDPLFDNAKVVKYPHGPVKFIQTIKVNDPNVPVKGYMEYMACDDEKCVGPFDVNYKADFKNLKAYIGDEVKEETVPGSNISDEGVYDAMNTSLNGTYQTPLGNCGESDVIKGQSLFLTFVFGFLGGLLALLTPCVFPMIPLTVSFFTKRSKDRASGIRNALIYGLSIIVIYVAVGLLITGVFGVTALQNLSTDAVANTIFFIVFVAFAISFFGYYEITLPSSWSTKSDKMAERGGLIGTFFMAFTLAIVSFSCTGPIIGSALVQSATNSLGPFVVMLGFSSALAIPFALFAAFPGWLNSLPRSGGWMNSVKVVLGFLELALALKFLSVADMTSHWNILPYEVFMVLWILIFGAMTLYLFGIIKFPHDSKGKLKIKPVRWGFIALSLAITIYLMTGFRFNDVTKSYSPLSLLSGLAPPTQYNLFLDEAQADPEIQARYPSFSKCANNLDCFKVYEEGVAYAKEVNKPILIDFTGYGCVNCRKTEETIWIVDDVWKQIAEDYVLISLYTDDRKKLDTPLTSARNGKKLRTIGSLWQEFQITNFDQNSQPLYVLATPDEKVMTAPRGYKSDIKAYSEFLECGMKVFETTYSQLGIKE